jgi:WD40 repeat protein
MLLPGHTEPIQAVAFAPDGLSAATAGQDATARVWSLSRIRASQRTSVPHGGAVTTVAYSPDGKTLATAVHNKGTLIWDLTNIKPTLRGELSGLAGGPRLVLITPDAETVVGVGVENQVINWSFRTGEVRSIWELPAGRALSVALTLDGRYFARGLADGTVEVFRVAEKRDK